MRFFLYVIALFTLFSCSNNKSSGFLNSDALPAEYFTILPDKDTTIKTSKGALIAVRSGTFNKETKLEVKEAYSLADMIKGGLTTLSDGNILSSGGMIYLQPEGGAEILKPIGISIPADHIDKDMQLFKGDEEDGSINWEDPKALDQDATARFPLGQQLFQQQCQSCHNLDGVGNAPAMGGFLERGPWKDREQLYAFVRNPPAFMACDPYTQGQKAQYGYVMTPFPSLSNEDIDAITDYVYNESTKNKFLSDTTLSCLDSCRIYDSLRLNIDQKRAAKNKRIIENNEKRVEVDYGDPESNQGGGRGGRGQSGELDLVQPKDYNAIYYKVTVQAPGWYNVDMLLKGQKGVVESVLSVKATDSGGNGVNVYLVIPSHKVFTPGGTLKGEKDVFGFYESNGKLPLPVGVHAYVFAISEADDQLLFAYRQFTTSTKHEMELKLQPMSKNLFNSIVSQWSIPNLDISAKDSRIREEMKKADKDIQSLQSSMNNFKPKTCDCRCAPVTPSDTSIVSNEYLSP
jgi:mono/diheme cytochrome c family protein